MMKTCILCGAEFTVRDKRQKLCSIACSTKHNAKNWNFMDPKAAYRLRQKKKNTNDKHGKTGTV